MGGDVLVLRIWKIDSLILIGKLKDIFDLRSIDEYTAQILTDPWAENPEIWELKITLSDSKSPFLLFKVRNFQDYVEKPYTEVVNW